LDLLAVQVVVVVALLVELEQQTKVFAAETKLARVAATIQAPGVQRVAVALEARVQMEALTLAAE
jgi:hypothetical protein